MFRKTASALLARAEPLIAGSDLRGFGELSESRRKLIGPALKAGCEVAGIPYKYGGNVAADQSLRVRECPKPRPVPIVARDITHDSFAAHLPRYILTTRRATVASDPISIRVIRLASKALGSSAMTFCQLMKERIENSTQSISVVASATHFAQPKPFPSRAPQTTERPPNAEPEISAVFAAAGLERYPASPQRKRNTPQPMSHLESVMNFS